MGAWRGVIEEYRAYLPVSASTPVVSLGEGNTPLVRAARLAEAIAPRLDLYLKFEGANPTGSFKEPRRRRPPTGAGPGSRSSY